MLLKVKTSRSAVILIAALLLALWPLPGTMAARNLLLLAGLIAAIPVIKDRLDLLRQPHAWPVYVLFSFFLWLIVHFVFFAGDRADQWHELIGDWPRNLFAAMLGLALGFALSAPQASPPAIPDRRLQNLLILGFSGTVMIFCGRYAYEIYRTGQWVHHDFFMTPYLGKTPLVIFGSIFLPLMFLKLLDGLKGLEHWQWFVYGALGIGATLITFYFGNTKNGFAIFALLLCYFLFCAVRQLIGGPPKGIRKGAGFALVVVSLLAFGIAAKKHLESNTAWSNLIADFKISVQIDKHTNWKDRVSPYPLNEFGQTVNASTYERVAWARAGLELLIEHPLGYGLINHSFGAMAINRWQGFHQPDGNNRGSTHSGWLDFTLGFGIIGLLLVWVPLVASFWRARKHTGFWGRYAVWAIPVIGFTYLTTEVCTGHFIELLFFLTAMFCGLTLKRPDEPSAAAGGSA
jgi:hypothetical protein